jgi:hypothetical protein
MQNIEECVKSILIDINSHNFLLMSDQGNQKFIECDTIDQFLNVLKVVKDNLSDDQIEYDQINYFEVPATL